MTYDYSNPQRPGPNSPIAWVGFPLIPPSSPNTPTGEGVCGVTGAWPVQGQDPIGPQFLWLLLQQHRRGPHTGGPVGGTTGQT